MHYSGLVVATDLDEELEPFADYHKVARFRHFVDSDELQLMAKEYAVDPSDLVALEKRLKEWREEEGGVHEGRLFTWSTDNPQAKFDWYEVGGRFGAFLQLREPRIETRWFGLRRVRVSHVTRARKHEVDPEPLLAAPPTALLCRGVWREAPMAIMQAPGPEWLREFAEAYGEIEDDAFLNAVDLHS
jgi:hypothetical protein